MSSILAKRPREDDELAGLGDLGVKKSRFDRDTNPTSSFASNQFLSAQFPFNSSTTSFPPLQHTTLSQQATQPPAEFAHTVFDDAIPEPFRQWREGGKQQSTHASLQARRPPTLTLDTAMDVDMIQASPFQNGDNLSPWPMSAKSRTSSNHLQPSPIPHHLLNQSLTISGGRTSTPIYSHFTMNMNSELMTDTPQTPTDVTPAPTAQNVTQSNWWRRRRLPSPISEAGDAPSELENEPFSNASNKSHLSTKQYRDWPDSPNSMDLDGDSPQDIFLQIPERKIEAPAHLPEQPKSEEKTTTSSTKTVSKHELTTGPRREKISFSMGYRADCEKCQMKVPGHYSHIVRS